MTRPLPNLELNLLIEHAGLSLRVAGKHACFLACFPTLISALHLVRFFGPWSHLLPADTSIKVEWRGVCFPIA